MRKFFTCKLFPTVFTLIALAGCTGSETLPYQPGMYLDDLWEYDGTSWTRITTGDTPAARRDHTAVMLGGTMYVFGGFNGTYLDEVWEYDFTNWTPKMIVGTPMPAARRGHSAVEYNGKMYIFGGFSGTLLNDLWEYDPAATGAIDSWKQISPDEGDMWPGARRYHTAVKYNDKMYIFGGDIGFYLNEVWEYNFTTGIWTQKSLTGTLPARRNGHSAVADSVSGKMYIFGGWTTNGIPLNDVWEYDLNTDLWSQQSPAPSPTARGAHSAVILGTEMFIFGGYDTAALDETWAYNLTNTWTLKNSGPPARYAHSAVVIGTGMYVFGGYGPPTQ